MSLWRKDKNRKENDFSNPIFNRGNDAQVGASVANFWSRVFEIHEIGRRGAKTKSGSWAHNFFKTPGFFSRNLDGRKEKRRKKYYLRLTRRKRRGGVVKFGYHSLHSRMNDRRGGRKTLQESRTLAPKSKRDRFLPIGVWGGKLGRGSIPKKKATDKSGKFNA